MVEVLIRARKVGIVFCMLLFIVFIQCGDSPKAQVFKYQLKPFTAHCLFVIDGDSFIVQHQKKSYEIRLWGIDAPEYDQPFASQAKKHLNSLIVGKMIWIIPKDVDKYDRLVAMAKIDKENVNSHMVGLGLAWVHRYYCRGSICDSWFEIENNARDQAIGIWSEPDPIQPWVWKKHK